MKKRTWVTSILFLFGMTLVVGPSFFLISHYYRPTHHFKKVAGSIWPDGVPPMLIKDEKGGVVSLSIRPASITPIDPPGPQQRFKTIDNRDVVPGGLFGRLVKTKQYEFLIPFAGNCYYRKRATSEAWSLLTANNKPVVNRLLLAQSNSCGVVISQASTRPGATEFERTLFFIRDDNLSSIELGQEPIGAINKNFLLVRRGYRCISESKVHF